MGICKKCRTSGAIAEWLKEHKEWEERGKGLYGKEWTEWDLNEPPCPCDYCGLNNFGYA